MDTSGGSISRMPSIRCFGEDGSTESPASASRINAQMAALELSIDKDWLRYKLSVFYASGDDNPQD